MKKRNGLRKVLVSCCMVSLLLSGCSKRQVLTPRAQGKNPYKSISPKKMSGKIRTIFKSFEEKRWSAGQSAEITVTPDPRVAELIQELALDPENIELEKSLAAAYFKAGFHFKSAQLYEEIQAKSPGDPESPRALARVWDRLGDYSLALHWAKRALLLDERSAVNFELLGRIHLHRNDLAAAAESFREASEFAPLDASILANLGYAYLGMKQWERARPYLQQALALDPGLVEARNNLGICLAQLGSSAPALREFARVNRPAAAYNNLGAVLVSQQRWSEARDAFETALRNEPGYGKALVNLAEVESHLTPPAVVNLSDQDFFAANDAVIQLEDVPIESLASQETISPLSETLPAGSDSLVFFPEPAMASSLVELSTVDLSSPAIISASAPKSFLTQLLADESLLQSPAKENEEIVVAADQTELQALSVSPAETPAFAGRRSFSKDLWETGPPAQERPWVEAQESAPKTGSGQGNEIPFVSESLISESLVATSAELGLEQIPRFDLERKLPVQDNPIVLEKIDRTLTQASLKTEQSSEEDAAPADISTETLSAAIPARTQETSEIQPKANVSRNPSFESLSEFPDEPSRALSVASEAKTFSDKMAATVSHQAKDKLQLNPAGAGSGDVELLVFKGQTASPEETSERGRSKDPSVIAPTADQIQVPLDPNSRQTSTDGKLAQERLASTLMSSSSSNGPPPAVASWQPFQVGLIGLLDGLFLFLIWAMLAGLVLGAVFGWTVAGASGMLRLGARVGLFGASFGLMFVSLVAGVLAGGYLPK